MSRPCHCVLEWPTSLEQFNIFLRLNYRVPLTILESLFAGPGFPLSKSRRSFLALPSHACVGAFIHWFQDPPSGFSLPKSILSSPFRFPPHDKLSTLPVRVATTQFHLCCYFSVCCCCCWRKVSCHTHTRTNKIKHQHKHAHTHTGTQWALRCPTFSVL